MLVHYRQRKLRNVEFVGWYIMGLGTTGAGGHQVAMNNATYSS